MFGKVFHLWWTFADAWHSWKIKAITHKNCATDRIIKQPSNGLPTIYWTDEKSILTWKEKSNVLPLSSQWNTVSSIDRIFFSSVLIPINNMESEEKKLTKDFHFDGWLPLLVSVGSDTLVCPCIFSLSFIQCEGGRWFIITGYCYVWSVRFYPVPVWSKPVYLLGNTYNWEQSKEQYVRNTLSKMYALRISEVPTDWVL